jgi:hypothetical protein
VRIVAKIVTVEIIIRGDIIENNVLIKFADMLRAQKFHADFTSSVAIPPFLVASEKKYPSLAVLYGQVEIEYIFQLKRLLEELAEIEKLEIITFKQL